MELNVCVYTYTHAYILDSMIPRLQSSEHFPACWEG